LYFGNRIEGKPDAPDMNTGACQVLKVFKQFVDPLNPNRAQDEGQLNAGILARLAA
jgi:hypothetical protein